MASFRRPRSARPLLPLVLLLAATGCAGGRPPLAEPGHSDFDRPAPAQFTAEFETTEGTFRAVFHREWAPRGVDRLYGLIRSGYYDGVRFFRVLDDFVAQFGLHGDPAVTAAWRSMRIPDDPVRESNVRGTITFATSGPDSRTTQLFINLGDNPRLDAMGFAPMGRVVEGMEVVEALHSGYGEGAPMGQGPEQPRIVAEGNAYLDAEFPELDAIIEVRVISETEG